MSVGKPSVPLVFCLFSLTIVIVSPTKTKGGHIGFSADPVGIGVVGVDVGVGRTNLCTHDIS